MSSGAIAERYAQALFDLGREAKSLSTLSQELTKFAEVVQENDQLRSVLTDPLLPPDQRRGLITALAEKLGISSLGVRSLLVIALRGRLSQLHSIATRFAEMVDEQAGVVRAHVTTASEMPESFFEALFNELQGATDKRVILERAVDPALIGGVIGRVGDSVLDASVRGRLEQFERETLEAISLGSS